jgi:hypothetical protein
MLDKILAWLCGDDPTDKILNDINKLVDAAYIEGARREREEILDILDRLIPQYVAVNNSVARQAREEIASRGKHV